MRKVTGQLTNMTFLSARAFALSTVLLALSSAAGGQQAARETRASPAFEALIREYEQRFLAAVVRTERPAVAFVMTDAPAIAQETLGKNWPAVREEALRRLNELPTYDPSTLEDRSWMQELDDVFQEAQVPVPEATQLAAERYWDPETAVTGCALMILGHYLSNARMGDTLTIAGVIGAHAYRATWNAKPALVVEYGEWVIAMEYRLTPEGVFFPVHAAIAHHSG
jgi:hypothetical protein